MSLPRVMVVPYLKGWSYDHTATAIKRHLSHRFEVEVIYQDEVDVPGKLETWRPDMVIDMWWNGRLHKRFPYRVMKQVSSHRWAMLQWGRLSASSLVSKHCTNTCGIMVPSHRLRDEFTEPSNGITVPVSIGPKGFEPSVLRYDRIRRGELVTGWAGNAKGKDKRVNVLVAADPHMRIADHCLTRGEMSDFYNDLDVIAIASDAEGDPRPLIEGMACGCFPISVDVGIVPELVRHGENGLIVERSVEAFAEAFEWCRRNIERVRFAGRLNAEKMLKTRTWSAVMPAWGDAIEAAIERGSHHAWAPLPVKPTPRTRKQEIRDRLQIAKRNRVGRV